MAIQGEAGAFSHQAALVCVGEPIELVSTPSFDALFAALAEGAAERALVPIENTLTGSIHDNEAYRMPSSNESVCDADHHHLRSS